ncbi:MAG TPA: chemotaxis protein CheW [Candidatus Jeotgalibaca pullicola]|nr:chemotaxis protein CheW [Candidatus Jeotgalibaca pullicola]
MQLVIISLKDKLYAVQSSEVDEITGPQKWTEVPKAPQWVLGLINLRGNILSLIDFDKFLNNHGNTQQEEKLCYNNTVIIKSGKRKVALALGDVEEVVDVDESHIQLMDEQVNDAVEGVLLRNDRVINLINLPTLFSENEG